MQRKSPEPKADGMKRVKATCLQVENKANQGEEHTMKLEDSRGESYCLHRVKVTKGCQEQRDTHPNTQDDAGRFLLIRPSKVILRETDKSSLNIGLKSEVKGLLTKRGPGQKTQANSQGITHSSPTLQRKGEGRPSSFIETSNRQTWNEGKDFLQKTQANQGLVAQVSQPSYVETEAAGLRVKGFPGPQVSSRTSLKM